MPRRHGHEGMATKAWPQEGSGMLLTEIHHSRSQVTSEQLNCDTLAPLRVLAPLPVIEPQRGMLRSPLQLNWNYKQCHTRATSSALLHFRELRMERVPFSLMGDAELGFRSSHCGCKICSAVRHRPEILARIPASACVRFRPIREIDCGKPGKS